MCCSPSQCLTARGSTLQRVAVRRNVLCGIVLCCRCVQSHGSLRIARVRGMLQCVAVCCSVLQHVAARCSALQCIVVRHSVLCYFAVCCNVLQCVAIFVSVLYCATDQFKS